MCFRAQLVVWLSLQMENTSLLLVFILLNDEAIYSHCIPLFILVNHEIIYLHCILLVGMLYGFYLNSD